MNDEVASRELGVASYKGTMYDEVVSRESSVASHKGIIYDQVASRESLGFRCARRIFIILFYG